MKTKIAKKIVLIIILSIILRTGIVLADNKWLEQPPILINNPLYYVYKSAIKLSLKLPLNSFTRAGFLNRILQENLFNIGFALENNYNPRDLVFEFDNYAKQLNNIIYAWQVFKDKSQVKKAVTNIQVSIFQNMLALTSKPLSELNNEYREIIINDLREITNNIYIILGPAEFVAILKNISTTPEQDIYLISSLFSLNAGALNEISQLLDYKIYTTYKDSTSLESLENTLDYLIKLLPKESNLNNILTKLQKSILQLKENLTLLNTGEVIIKDLETFEKLKNELQQAIQEAKLLLLKGSFEEALHKIEEANSLLEKMNSLFIKSSSDSSIRSAEIKTNVE